MIRRFVIAFLVMQPVFASSQEADVQRPKDSPVNVKSDRQKAFEAMIAPCIAIAKRTLPEAKKRFLAGLRQHEIFYVTARLSDPDGKYEALFIAVKSWDGDVIQGYVDNDVELLKSYKRGDRLQLRETDAIDWTFSNPDGTEDGNFIGKQIDSPKHDVCKDGSE